MKRCYSKGLRHLLLERFEPCSLSIAAFRAFRGVGRCLHRNAWLRPSAFGCFQKTLARSRLDQLIHTQRNLPVQTVYNLDTVSKNRASWNKIRPARQKRCREPNLVNYIHMKNPRHDCGTFSLETSTVHLSQSKFYSLIFIVSIPKGRFRSTLTRQAPAPPTYFCNHQDPQTSQRKAYITYHKNSKDLSSSLSDPRISTIFCL